MMGSNRTRDRTGASELSPAAQFTDEAAPAEARAWEKVEAGRYMPRRIKGSCRGRALG
jgi:hypothetical protein